MIENFVLIIGAMKCGTTSLFNYLSEHPQICACNIKEPNFFANDSNWMKGFDWYQSLWDYNPQAHAIALEASTHYTKIPRFPNAAERIAELKLNFKFIYVIRNPIERIESQYTHGLQAKWESTKKPISEEINPHLIELSSYAMQIEEYYKRFKSGNILLLDFEDLKIRPLDLVKQVYSFLDIDTSHIPRNIDKTYNPNQGRFIDGNLWPFVRPAAQLLPTKASNAVRFKLGQKIRDNIKLSEKQRNFVLEELQDDLRKLNLEYGFDVSRWCIDI